MNLRIEVPPHLEQALKLRAEQAGKDIEAFVIQSLQESLDLPAQPTPKNFQQWLLEIHALIPPSDHHIDDSRESIYAGRGE